jgi:Lrp/AsnC family leucine-responsive transcriptional regulator
MPSKKLIKLDAINRLCDELSADKALKIQKILTRIVLERSEFYLGYPIAKLKWLE